MATLAELSDSINTLQSDLNTGLADLSAKISALEAQVGDPTLLDPLKASVDAMVAQVTAADPGPQTPPAAPPA